MKVNACQVPESAMLVLLTADFADAFSTEYPIKMSAIEVAHNATNTMPKWVDNLMQVRRVLVKPFGLVTTPQEQPDSKQFVGFFPIISIAENRVVLGLDDKHLDFRLVVDTASTPTGGTYATLSTVIKRHNIWGKIYLAVVLPFHKIIVPSIVRHGLKRLQSQNVLQP